MLKRVIHKSLALFGREIRRIHQAEEYFATIPLATVLDIGANLGQFAQSIRKSNRKAVIHSFEPIPNIAKKLRSNFSDDDKLFVHEIAISDRNGEATFEVNEFSPSSSLLPVTGTHKKAFPFAQNTQAITVNVK